MVSEITRVCPVVRFRNVGPPVEHSKKREIGSPGLGPFVPPLRRPRRRAGNTGSGLRPGTPVLGIDGALTPSRAGVPGPGYPKLGYNRDPPGSLLNTLHTASSSPLRQTKADPSYTLCYAIVLPGRKSAFRAGFWPDCYRERTEIGPPAGGRPAGGRISVLSR